MVEDDFVIAMDITDMLQEAGAVVLGPVGRVAEAIELLETLDRYPDLAVLDLDLHGARSYSIADALDGRGVRVLFTTGYGSEAIAPQYRHHARIEKPVNQSDLLAALIG